MKTIVFLVLHRSGVAGVIIALVVLFRASGTVGFRTIVRTCDFLARRPTVEENEFATPDLDAVVRFQRAAARHVIAVEEKERL